MKVIFDGKEIGISKDCKNIVELAIQNKIELLAPCYKSNYNGGCCSTCIVDVDGERCYACSTTPKDGMRITYNRDDLINDRQERLIAYEKYLSKM